MTPHEAAHYKILRLIEKQPDISQRELARALGVSLGKSHYLLKALLEKGLIKVECFRRHQKKLAYAYLLTPRGLAAKLELAYAFLRYKEAEYAAVHDEIAQLKREIDKDIGDANALVAPEGRCP